MQYPRIIVLHDEKLKELLTKKTQKIIEGRELTQEIEDIQKEMDNIDERIQVIEKTVNVDDLKEENDKINKEFDALMVRMKAVEKEIYNRMKVKVPAELGQRYESKKKEKEVLENKRKKEALKIQKWKDIIIPRTQKIAKEYLQDEFEDFNEIRIENGEVILEIFSHLEAWKEARRNKLNDKEVAT